MGQRHRDLDSARQFGRSLQYLHDLQPAVVSSGNDILPILAVNNVLYDAQPKQITVSGLADALSPYITGGGGGTAGISGVSPSLSDVIVVSGTTNLAAVDPGSDQLAFWDDSESKFTYLTVGSGLTISGTVISSTGGGGSASASGINGSVQYFSGGLLAGDTNFRWDSGLDLLTIVNQTGVVASGGLAVTSGNAQINAGDVVLNDGGAYTTTLQCITPTANRTISLPDSTGTVALVPGSVNQIPVNISGALAGTSALTFDPAAGLRTTQPFGYATGAGNGVTQATSKTTAVTINAVCGDITMNSSTLASGERASFTMINNKVADTDVIILNNCGVGTLGAYQLSARAVSGSGLLAVRNVTTSGLSEALVLRFAVIKAVTS